MHARICKRRDFHLEMLWLAARFASHSPTSPAAPPADLVVRVVVKPAPLLSMRFPAPPDAFQVGGNRRAQSNLVKRINPLDPAYN
jgi:hypothetical protein